MLLFWISPLSYQPSAIDSDIFFITEPRFKSQIPTVYPDIIRACSSPCENNHIFFKCGAIIDFVQRWCPKRIDNSPGLFVLNRNLVPVEFNEESFFGHDRHVSSFLQEPCQIPMILLEPVGIVCHEQ